jgi:glycosyltransferase involved in cell wall biosynthesis
VDALFFPSLAESYGLPLVEAMVMGLPVVCADLPYAHWLCADQALYFDPADPAAAREAIAELDRRRLAGWRPDWSRALARIPKSWNEVGARFLELLSER